ncbi:MFS transporter [Streptomyces sp. NPDC001933]|uniref:MFS transporter n=1 Tax=Streptomyces sp. NPDC001933 TaxID=3364626 RepID=UPI0036CB3BAC
MDRQRSGGQWWLLAVLCLATLVVSLDITILNVALPTISESLHATTAELQWIVDSYSLAFAGAMLPAGLFGDRYGRKRVLLGGLGIFAVASVWSALADSTGALIAARTLMGAGAAIVMPLTLAFVASTFSAADRPKAIAVITAAIAGGLPLGPIVGGFLLEHFYWGSVFWINVPVVAIAVAAGVVLLRESRNPAAARLDVPGALLAVGGIVALIYGFISAPEVGWSSVRTVVLLVGSVVLFAAFVLWERRAADKLVDPALFRNARFTWGTMAAVAVSVALFGVLFVVPQFLQAVHGHDALGTGLRLVPLMGGLLVAGGVAGPVDKLIGTKITVLIGLLVLAVGLVVLSQVTADGGYGPMATGLTLCGVGIGGAMAPAMDAVTAEVGDEAGAGAAVTNTLRQIGGALAVAVLGSVMSAVYSGGLGDALLGLPAPAADAARESVMGAAVVADGMGPQGAPLRAAAGAAFADAMSTVMLSCAGVVLLGAALCLLFLPARASGAVASLAVADRPVIAG